MTDGRREKGTGTIVKRGDRFSVVIDFGKGPDGKRIRRWHSGYRSETAAARALHKLLDQRDEGAYVAPTRLTLGYFLEQRWLPSLTAPNYRPSTVSLYKTQVTAYVVPRLGQWKLTQLTAEHLDGLYRDLLANGRRQGDGGLSPRAVRIVHVVIRRALADAQRWGLVARNVAELARPPKDTPPEKGAWSPEQMAKFLAANADDRLCALWHLAMATGARRGELAGLKWAAVDLENATITISTSRVMVDSQAVESAPKTKASRRRIAIDTETVAVLRAHRAQQHQKRLALRATYQDGGYVFAHENGRPLSPSLITRTFARRVEQTGLPAITLHGLRHSHVSALLRAGASIQAVSERVGHANSTVTLSVYSHAFDGDDAVLAATAGQLLTDARAKVSG